MRNQEQKIEMLNLKPEKGSRNSALKLAVAAAMLLGAGSLYLYLSEEGMAHLYVIPMLIALVSIIIAASTLIEIILSARQDRIPVIVEYHEHLVFNDKGGDLTVVRIEDGEKVDEPEKWIMEHGGLERVIVRGTIVKTGQSARPTFEEIRDTIHSV